MKILDGRQIAENVITNLTDKIIKLSSKPGLAIILVGDDPGSHVYVGLKEKAAKMVGINIKKYYLPDDIEEGKILKIINGLNSDKSINGILVQFPLPDSLDENKIIQAIDPGKDVDGYHPKNIDLLIKGQDCLVPGLAEGIIKLLDHTNQDIHDKKAVIVANSDTFSQPLKYLLKLKNLVVTVIHPNDNNFDDTLMKAEIIIVAIGRPRFIKKEMIKKNAIIIDVGYNRVNNKPVGDVDFESVKKKVSWIAPVPGGVGPMTVVMLLNNVLKAYETQSR